MAHKYYCTHCARELTQELVLLDMEPALTVRTDEYDEKGNKLEAEGFRLLKFRLTIAEFQALLERGTVGDLGFKHFDLSIEELAGYMANERNLKDLNIGKLTLADIDDYLKYRNEKEFGKADQSADQPMDFSGDTTEEFSMDALLGSEETVQETAEESYKPSEAIRALMGQIATAQSDEQKEQLLREDLSMLRKFVGENGCIQMAVKVRTEKADTGDDMVIGYYARRGEKKNSVEARCCSYCGTPVFQHAGAAEHKAVAFIGHQGSGKTSTILALTHYARRAARRVDMADPIWHKSSKIHGIEIMEVVGENAKLKKDLGLYDMGIAPAKTKSTNRLDAYSATLWITNSQEKKFILTLIDLPGELCLDDGTLRNDVILNEFPVAMASDVFIMCFDTVKAKKDPSNEMVSRTCSWASEFQKLRRDYKQATVIAESGDNDRVLTPECLAPMMIVFTKCEELEKDTPEKPDERSYLNPRRVDEIYSLKVEREFIDRNTTYKDVGEMVRVYGDLKHAYVARLRTSPYGFDAPNEEKILEKKETNLNPDGTVKYPRPKQVDKLMKWLMVVCGCVPAAAEYIPNPREPEHAYRPENFFVCGAQYRIWKPQGKSFKDRVNEAMCRAYLFENYSEMDKGYIENYNDPSWERTIGERGKGDEITFTHGLFGKIKGLFGR